MRITVVTQQEPFYLPPALDELCRIRGKDICSIVILPSFNESKLATAKRLYRFYGPFDFARLLVRFVGAAIADFVNRLYPVTRPYSAEDVSRRHDIPVYKPANINRPDFIESLTQGSRPDLLVSIAASQIFKKAVLEAAPLGCINLHSAPLPRYQGMMPNFWTMVHGEEAAAVTIHYMVPKLDAGDIILQKAVPILPKDSLHDLMVRSKKVGIQAMLEAIEQIERGTADREPMDATKATYFSFPKRADAARLRAMGRSLL